MKVESLDQLEKAYVAWRKRKRHVREAVPDELIDRTHLAAVHFGGTAVSRAIKIDWQRLSKKRPLKKPAIPSFSRLELPSLPSLDRPLAELETPAGMKLRIYSATPEALALLSSLCGLGNMR